MDGNMSKKKNRGNLVWPLVLVVVGVILLLNNIGVLSGNVWEMIWRFWPLLLIVLGLDSLFRRGSITGPLFLIGLGMVFLLNNFGVLAWDVWFTIWRLWPILIISLGLDILIGQRIWWKSLIGLILIVAILFAVISLAGIDPIRGQAVTGTTIEQELGAARTAEINVSPAIGDLDVGSLSDSDKLIVGSVGSDRFGQIMTDYSLRDDEAEFSLESRSGSFNMGSGQWKWDLRLNPVIPIGLNVNMGGGDINLELGENLINELNVSQGLGDISLLVSDKASSDVNLSQAIGQITVDIPRGLEIELRVDKALSNLSVPSNFVMRGESYFSPNSVESDNRLKLDIEQAIGNIVIRYLDWE